MSIQLEMASFESYSFQTGLTCASVSYTIVSNIPRRLTRGATEEEFRIKYFQNDFGYS